MKLLTLVFFFSVSCLYAQDPSGGPAIDLKKAVRMALHKSPQVSRAQESFQLAAMEDPFLLAATDPVFLTQVSFLDDSAPRAAPAFQGSFTKSQSFEAAVSKTMLIGTEAKFSFLNERVENPAVFRLLDPTVDSKLNFELRQPLLKRFWGRPDKIKRSQARASVRIAQKNLDWVREQVAAETVKAWLDLFYAGQEFEIRKLAQQDAQTLLDTYRQKQPYGLVDETDLLQAEVSVRARSIEKRLSASRVKIARDKLKISIGSDENVYVTSGPLLADLTFTEKVALERAAEQRGDISAVRTQVERFDLNFRLTKLEKLPDLNLFGSYGVAGLDTRLGKAVQDLGGFSHPVFSGGISLTIPFGSEKEKLNVRDAGHRLSSARADLAHLMDRANLEVRSALERKNEAEERLEAVELLLEVERKKLYEEKREFERGRSNTDLLIRFMLDVRRAEIDRLKAQLDRHQALTDLALVTGQCLKWVDQAKP